MHARLLYYRNVKVETKQSNAKYHEFIEWVISSLDVSERIQVKIVDPVASFVSAYRAVSLLNLHR